jgi:PleD family two-component response regulator
MSRHEAEAPDFDVGKACPNWLRAGANRRNHRMWSVAMRSRKQICCSETITRCEKGKGDLMESKILVMILNEDAEMLRQLESLLRRQNIPTRYAVSCGRARQLLAEERPPDVIFTGSTFSDGTWRDVLLMARHLEPRPAVVLTTRLDDMDLYLDAMSADAFDYIVPPFAPRDLVQIIASASAHELSAKYRAAGSA